MLPFILTLLLVLLFLFLLVLLLTLLLVLLFLLVLLNIWHSEASWRQTPTIQFSTSQLSQEGLYYIFTIITSLTIMKHVTRGNLVTRSHHLAESVQRRLRDQDSHLKQAASRRAYSSSPSPPFFSLLPFFIPSHPLQALFLFLASHYNLPSLLAGSNVLVSVN